MREISDSEIENAKKNIERILDSENKKNLTIKSVENDKK